MNHFSVFDSMHLTARVMRSKEGAASRWSGLSAAAKTVHWIQAIGINQSCYEQEQNASKSLQGVGSGNSCTLLNREIYFI